MKMLAAKYFLHGPIGKLNFVPVRQMFLSTPNGGRESRDQRLGFATNGTIGEAVGSATHKADVAMPIHRLTDATDALLLDGEKKIPRIPAAPQPGRVSLG